MDVNRKRKRSAEIFERKRPNTAPSPYEHLFLKAEASWKDESGRLWAEQAHLDFLEGLKIDDITVQQWCAFALGNMLAEHTPNAEAAVLCAMSVLKTMVTATDAATAEMCAFALSNAVRTDLLTHATVFSVLTVAGDWLLRWSSWERTDAPPGTVLTVNDTAVQVLGAVAYAINAHPPPEAPALLQFARMALRLATEQLTVDETVCVAALQVLVLVMGRFEPGATVLVPDRSAIGPAMAAKQPGIYRAMEERGECTPVQLLILTAGLLERAHYLNHWIRKHEMSTCTRELYAGFLRGVLFDGTEATLQAAHARGCLGDLMQLAKCSASRSASRRIVSGVIANLLPFPPETQGPLFAFLVHECGATVLVADAVMDLAGDAAHVEAGGLDAMLLFLRHALELPDSAEVKAAARTPGLEPALGRLQAKRSSPDTVSLVTDILARLDLRVEPGRL